MSLKRMTYWVALAVGLADGGAFAQDRSTYPTNQNPSAFSIDWVGFYDTIDAWTKTTREELEHHLDVAYGPDPKQKLDLYVPETPEGPVFLFIHGGGFVEGDRAHYGYVARPLAELGVITAVMSYRLSPHHYPDQADDTKLALEWLYRRVARYDGDPMRLLVGGHSAGAILSAFVAVSRDWMSERDMDPAAIRGVVPVSGPYDLRAFGSFVATYLPPGTDRAAASPALVIDAVPPPMVIAFGKEEDVFREPSHSFAETLRVTSNDVVLLELDGNHDDSAKALWDRESQLFRAVETLIRDQAR